MNDPSNKSIVTTQASFFFIYKIAIKDGHCLEGQSKFEQLSEILTKVENILTHWSVAQAGLNDEQNGGRASGWTVPLSRLSLVDITRFYTFS